MTQYKTVLSELISSGKYETKSGINPYRNFAKLRYKLATGKSRQELIQERKILSHISVEDYFSNTEKRLYEIIDLQFTVRLMEGKTYSEIKDLLHNQHKAHEQKR